VRRGNTQRALFVTVIGFILFAFLVPLPYVIMSPGPATNTLGADQKISLITISGHATFPTDGELDLTTVSVSRPDSHLRAPLLIRAWLSSDAQIVPRDAIYPPDQNINDINGQNTEEMKSSQEHATTAALRYLGYNLGSDVVVQQIPKGSPSLGILRAGDVIRALQGVDILTSAQLRSQMALYKAGDVLSVTVDRSKVRMTLSVKTGKNSAGRAFLGILPADQFSYPFSVDIRLKDVGGPSAGMMFALGIIDKLTPGSMTRKRIIAGTGTIDDNGNVGAIGGINDKILGAYRHGARLFLSPMSNCADVHTVPKGMHVVGVETLTQAVAALQSASVAANASISCGTNSAP
jgi:PDZ domain-containing protein